MTTRPLIAVVVAAVVTIGAAAFALGRGVASDSSDTATGAAATTVAPSSGPATPVGILDFAFDPQDVTVKVGDAVTWTNGDSVAHSVKSGDGSFVSGNIDQGQSFSSTFATAGTFAYICGIHNSMTGTVVVEP